MKQDDRPGVAGARIFGVLLGFAGALLDFYSAYSLLTAEPVGAAEGMGMGAAGTGYFWGVGTGFLGAVLLVTSLAALVTRDHGRMRGFGALMVVYGAAMLFIGGSMAMGLEQMAPGTSVPGYGMLLVGVLMVANGAVMMRGKMIRGLGDSA